MESSLQKAGVGVRIFGGAVGSYTGSVTYYSGGGQDAVTAGGSVTTAHNVKNKNHIAHAVPVYNMPNLLLKLNEHLVLQGGGS